jgi:hypothetical protein
MTERQPWEHESREELAALLAAHQQELATTPAQNRERREWLKWHIRRVEKRVAEVEARLRASTQK